MKIPVIKKLLEAHSLESLQQAENNLYEGEALGIEVKGEDEGEQLTHIMAAIEILKDMAENGHDAKTALRNYTKRVRDSIS